MPFNFCKLPCSRSLPWNGHSDFTGKVIVWNCGSLRLWHVPASCHSLHLTATVIATILEPLNPYFVFEALSSALLLPLADGLRSILQLSSVCHHSVHLVALFLSIDNLPSVFTPHAHSLFCILVFFYKENSCRILKLASPLSVLFTPATVLTLLGSA